MKTVYDFAVKDRKGKDVRLKEYQNEVLLIVNTATKCGFTPQYDELEALYKKYHADGFEVLDFPCNQFGQQAPGTDESIHEFCKLTFGTDFPRFKWSTPLHTSSTTCCRRPIPTTRRVPTSSGTSRSSSSTSADRW